MTRFNTRSERRKRRDAESAAPTQNKSRTDNSGAASSTRRSDDRRVAVWPVCMVVFALALVVRLLYLYDSSDSPVFNTPIVDSATYNELARSLVHTGELTDQYFWQPFFYPAFLTVLYKISDCSILFAKISQILLGSVTCTLVCLVGSRLFGKNTGLLAGMIAALYGPLIFFDAELLGTGWGCFWSIALIALFLRVSVSGRGGGCLLLGICGGLSILCRPTFLPFFGAASIGLVCTFYRQRVDFRRSVLNAALLVGGFCLATAPVSFLCARCTGQFAFLPRSAGINLYVGNNADSARTIAMRPGWDWDELTRLPARHGVTRSRDTSEFFRRQAWQYIRSEPLGFASGLGAKALQLASSRELPRNVDAYLYRKWSWTLSALLWKAGSFGFPFGVLLPLALVGLGFHRRIVPLPLWFFLTLYPVSVVLVFVAARYRMPLVPILALPAAAGCMSLFRLVKCQCWSKLGVIGVCATIVAVLTSLPGPFAQEKTNYEAEMYYVLGRMADDENRLDEANRLLTESLRLSPAYGDAHNALGKTLQSRGQLDAAMRHYESAVEIHPAHGTALANLARLCAKQGKLERAIEYFREAVAVSPYDASLHTNFAVALTRRREFDEALHYFARALALAPGNADKHNNMASVLVELGRTDEAVKYYKSALEIQPDHFPALVNLVTALKDHGKKEEALSVYRSAISRAEASGDTELVARLEGALEDQF